MLSLALLEDRQGTSRNCDLTRFLRMLGARLGYAYMETPVLQLEQRFNLQSLYHQRIIFDLLFLFKLINGLVDCPALLEMVDLSVPRERDHGLFSAANSCPRTTHATVALHEF
ncbi:hypothetical protein J6590_062798 [Homalodisca vitripennis]|nr:hypothetical protein J6590_062798 [Homalodisca vitripennis]